MTQALAANSVNASCNSPAAGGAANSGPTIAKRSPRPSIRCGRSFSSPHPRSLGDAILGVPDENEDTAASDAGFRHPLRAAYRPSDYLAVARVLKGAMKRSTCIRRSCISPASKRSSRLGGRCVMVTGGMNRSRTDCQNELRGNPLATMSATASTCGSGYSADHTAPCPDAPPGGRPASRPPPDISGGRQIARRVKSSAHRTFRR